MTNIQNNTSVGDSENFSQNSSNLSSNISSHMSLNNKTNRILLNNSVSPANMKSIIKKSMLPTNDVIFHCLFGTVGNERITKDFLEKILDMEVHKIDLDLNLDLIREHYDSKLGILDVRAKTSDGTNYNIEMQNSSYQTLPERLLSYWARLYSGDLRRGNNYDILAKTIVILIVNDEIDRFNFVDKYHTQWNIREKDYKDLLLTDQFEIHIIELPKYIKYRKDEKYKNVWLDFMLKPDGKEVLKAMDKCKELKEARQKWYKITADDRIRDRALRLEMAELDHNTRMKYALEDGFKQGVEKGIEQIVINMYSNNLSLEDISKLTKVDIEKVKSILDKNK